MAGAGINGGRTIGATDELGLNVVEDKTHVHDVQATVLHLLGLEHTRLTYRYLGRVDFLDFVRTLNAIGYTGYVSVDCLPPKPDWKTLVDRSIDFMKGVEDAAALQESMVATTAVGCSQQQKPHLAGASDEVDVDPM